VPLLLSGPLPPDIVLMQTSVPAGGTVSLGTEVNVLPAAIEAVRARGGLVIAQLNPRVPYTYGDSQLPCDVIDYAIEAEMPLASPPERPATESSAIIGDRVAALIGDGATLQAGIGAAPDAILAGLHGRRGLTVWSEMFSDGVLNLAKAGALDPRAAGHGVLRVRQPGSLRLDGPQPGGANAADGDSERPGTDRPPPAHGLSQQRTPG
jgi:acyl-CoA hydrolase